MENVVERVRLVQAPFNNLTMALYSKLGFDVREPLSVMQSPAVNVTIPGCLVRPASEDDIEAGEFTGPGFHVPSPNADLMRWCLANGLRIRQPMTLMSIGPYREPDGAFIPSVIF